MSLVITLVGGITLACVVLLLMLFPPSVANTLLSSSLLPKLNSSLSTYVTIPLRYRDLNVLLMIVRSGGVIGVVVSSSTAEHI